MAKLIEINSNILIFFEEMSFTRTDSQWNVKIEEKGRIRLHL